MPDARTLADNAWLRVPLFAVFLFESAALVARSYFEVRLRERGYDPDYAGDLSYLVVPPILVLLMYPVMRKHGAQLLALYRFRYLSLRVIAIGVVLGVALRCAFWGGLIAMTSFGISVGGDDRAAAGPYLLWSCPPPAQLALGIFVSAVLIPPIEEAVNRGFFLHGLLHRGVPIAMLGSAVLFAVHHNPQTIYIAFVIGLFFAAATLNSGALWISSIAHGAYNLTSQIDWRCLSGHWNPDEVTPVMAGVGTFATAMLIITLLFCCLLISKRIIGAPGGAR